jgi:amidohydrolase
MARLGTRTHGGPTFDLHQGDLVVDEDAVTFGARLLSSVAVLRRRAPEQQASTVLEAR